MAFDQFVKRAVHLPYAASSRMLGTNTVQCTSQTELSMSLQDTFLNAGHLKESFPGSQVEVQKGHQQAEPQRPFKVTFAQPPAQPQADGKVCLALFCCQYV